MTINRLWPRPLRPSSNPFEFRRRRPAPHPRLPAPQGGKIPPSAGPSREVGARPVADGCARIHIARSLAPGYRFVDVRVMYVRFIGTRAGRKAATQHIATGSYSLRGTRWSEAGLIGARLIEAGLTGATTIEAGPSEI